MTVSNDGVVALDPQVALRPERFGALAYHFGNRKLSFLKHPDLVAVLEAADGTRTVAELFDLAGIPEIRRPSFLAALETLERSEMVRISVQTSTQQTSTQPTSTQQDGSTKDGTAA
jgi:putative mycofactocin binding protein MftB